ncbi:MAG: hypothetical protein IPK88_18315 [Saprospiraceae bacterium]|nr:hypothetical protein [Candidatus Defluviibacterium haderslevense]
MILKKFEKTQFDKTDYVQGGILYTKEVTAVFGTRWDNTWNDGSHWTESTQNEDSTSQGWQ